MAKRRDPTKPAAVEGIGGFLSRHMRQGERYVPARLQAALALLERVRDEPSLSLSDHLTPNGQGAIVSHETYGNAAHQRFDLLPLNKTHGRRSSNIQSWGQLLLDHLRSEGYDAASAADRRTMIDAAQGAIVALLREIIEQNPLEARLKGRSAETVIEEILDQAEQRGKSGDVAQYLVGAKLMLRFDREIPVHPANKADRKSIGDRSARRGDFEIENTVIEVAVGTPDEKHVRQVVEALDEHDYEIRLLTRSSRVCSWQLEFAHVNGVDLRRLVVASVEGFVGQNIAEMGQFTFKGGHDHLKKLFALYNDRWVATVGTPGIRIEVR